MNDAGELKTIGIEIDGCLHDSVGVRCAVGYIQRWSPQVKKHTMPNETVLLDREPLAQFVAAIFGRAGLKPEHARIVADDLVWANLRGADSHGVLRIPLYLNCLDKGHMNPRPDVRVIAEAGAVTIIDADRAVGPIGMRAGMEQAIRRARETTIGWTWVRNSTHCGAIGYYALMALEQDMAALVMNATRPLMAPHGGATPTLGTNPICLAVPGGADAPLVFDMATSAIAMGNVLRARATGEPLPAGTVLDRKGRPTTDAGDAHTLLPAAGPKGSGLSLLIELFTSMMVANPLLEDAGTSEYSWDMRQNGLTVAVDIARFADLADFRRNVGALVANLKAQPPAGGTAEILVPGERGERTYRERVRAGIPIDGKTWQTLGGIADRLGLERPAPRPRPDSDKESG